MSASSQIRRIGVFYDGVFLNNVSNYYFHHHERQQRISLSGLHKYIEDRVAAVEGVDARRCQIVDAAYFRGRKTAQQAKEADSLYGDRLLEDALMRADITLYQKHVAQSHDGDYQEKGIDVWLALEAYEAASLKRYDVLVLITGDGDFVPLVRKLNTLGSRVMLLGWDFEYEFNGAQRRTRTSQQLIEAVNYPVAMATEIDSRENRNDSLIAGLFMPKLPDGAPRTPPAPQAKPFARPEEPKAPVPPAAVESRPAEQVAAPLPSSAADPLKVSQQNVAPQTGTVKAVYTDKMYGFIARDNGGPDIFFHVRQLANAMLTMDLMGSRVTFVELSTAKGMQAGAVRVQAPA